MGPLRWFLVVYVLGGLTFVPLLLAAAVAFIFYTSRPYPNSTLPEDAGPEQLLREDDDEKLILKSGTDDLAEKFHRKHDSDVAAGYFAVCREYVPGGVNGKPPDKLSPAGEVVANESPSVYQTMYRSIFDRSQKPTIEPHKDGAGKQTKQANNVFYVVIRHGHLMLYDDIQQLEVRYVISLDYHDVSIYGGSEEPIPEGELWVKRHAIRLKRKQSQVGDKNTSLPIFLFSENLSEKEDFYFALLKNQRQNQEDIPEAEQFDGRHMVNLVQKLHSSEEHLATRWLNAMIGRLFLAIYKTEELEDFIRNKLMKKLSRVKKPTFITRLALQKIDMGLGGPFVTNPRLRDLTMEGDCTVEADVDYTGNFRLEVGATARIELGTRFKAREVDLVLAITVKKLRGHALVRFKPPPSNRIWITFEKMPLLDLAVEPVVSSRQITYTVILRAIESRIREVFAESMVLPFWDDIAFLRTDHQKYRGGIWKREVQHPTSVEVRSEEAEDEAETGGSGTKTPDTVSNTFKDDRNLSMPVLSDLKKLTADRKAATSLGDIAGPDSKQPPTPPRMIRSKSFATAADPMVTTNNADSDFTRSSGEQAKRDSAASVLKDLSARSQTGSTSSSLAGSPPSESSLVAAAKARSDSLASKASDENQASSGRHSASEKSVGADNDPVTSTAINTQRALNTAPTTSTQTSRPSSVHEDGMSIRSLAQAAKSLTATDRKQALASAQATAQKWSGMGWGVLARNRQQKDKNETVPGNASTASPIGRGQPLPPPGQPLPGPPKPIMSGIGGMLAKRKPSLPKRPEDKAAGSKVLSPNGDMASTASKPPLPARHRPRQSSRADLNLDNGEDEVMIVEAPIESAPTSPVAESRDGARNDFFGSDDHEDDTPTAVPRPLERTSTVVAAPEASSSAASASTVNTKDPLTAENTTSDHPKTDDAHENDLSGHHAVNGSSQRPQLPPRQSSSPPSPVLSIRRKPLQNASALEKEGGRSSTAETAESITKEQSLAFTDDASNDGKPTEPETADALNSKTDQPIGQ